MQINNRLNLILKEKNMSQAELSRLLGFSKGNISRYFSGKEKPGRKFLMLLYEKLNVSSDWLLTGEGSMFIGESCKPDQEYFQLITLLKEHGFSENDALKLFEHYVKPQSKQVFDLFIAASQGDKEALVKIRQYLDTMEMLFK